jgi:ubiquinone/menaquinone biosynthesis C-methylase UbiE
MRSPQLDKANLTAAALAPQALRRAIRAYWNVHIHDLAMAQHAMGTREFFAELAAYRFSKLAYLPRLVHFSAYTGKHVLEVGCGIGLDLVCFAEHGAVVTGVDLAPTAIRLARKNFAQHGLQGDLRTMNGEALQFSDNHFDVVYAHSVLQYTHDAARMIHELYRVLKPGGEAILMVYNRYSWLNALATLCRVELEHAEAPVFRLHSIPELKRMLRCFKRVDIIPERFPVPTRLHHGLQAAVYNAVFVTGFRLLPKALVRPFGWHLLAKAVK